ncbi:cysteine--tRNA ligase [Aquihabitans sp. McL0605]|uniref:cysteine--tRNA ligase n=1 Tax=Aquihabitans sp. McL0605 TaxID=3415671 RepID=UPI003CFB0FF8
MSFPAIHLYDTRRRAVVPFEPLVPGHVGIYTCGPTVYAPQTLGNMRSQFTPDLLRRVLIASGLAVTFVTNITDVGHLTSDADDGDDKMEKTAKAQGISAADVAAHWTEQWATDRRRLGMLEPDVRPAASEHIAEQIAMVQELEAQGRTYVIDDGVYFDVATFPAYADFAGLDLDELEATGRVDNSDKRHPADFALWKLSPAGSTRLQEWDSPWGVGFPGWHIECSAMATKYLGDRFDIHTGGVDHIRVHHTNEVAQSECSLGVHPWVSVWVHTEFLDLKGRKISKSAGDVLLVDTLVDEGIEPLAFRYFLLQAHYRQQQEFTFDGVRAAGTALRRLVHHAVVARDAVDGATDGDDPARTTPFREAFWGFLADDLNSPRALSVASTVARSTELTDADRWSLLADFDRALGFGLADATDPEQSGDESADPRIAALLAERTAARAAKDWAEADRIRDVLAAEGLEVVDTPDGPQARRR